MKRMLFATLACVPLLASAAGVADKCTTKANPEKKKSQWLKEATVKVEEAQGIAFDATKSDKLVKLVWEEEGCFVYAMTVKNTASNAHSLVVVDPGNGKILRQAKVDAPPVAAVPPKQKSAAGVAREMAAEKAKAGDKPKVGEAPKPPEKPKAPEKAKPVDKTKAEAQK